MNVLKQLKMSKVLLSFWVAALGVCFSLSAQIIVTDSGELQRFSENQQQLIISPKTHLILQPDVMEEYSSVKGVSIRPGTSIRPVKNGWFRASIQEVSNPLSESTAVASIFRVYPNPVESGKMKVNIPEEKVNLKLFDLNGRQLDVPMITKGELQIEVDMSNLKPGIYLLQCLGSNKIFQKKVLKQ